MRMSVIFKSEAIEFRLTFWGYASRSATRPNPAAAAPIPRNLRRPIVPFIDITLHFATMTDSRFATVSLYPDLYIRAYLSKQMLPPGDSLVAAVQLRRLDYDGVRKLVGPGVVRRRSDAVCWILSELRVKIMEPLMTDLEMIWG
jgi:hypothetical protein